MKNSEQIIVSSSAEYSVIKSMQNMTDYQKNKIVRLSIRLLNNDVKAHKLIQMLDSGAISNEQFLNMI